MRSNDDPGLAPVTSFDGPALSFDIPGLRVGVAEYAEGPTGCTVFALPPGSRLVTDIRGGSPGVVGAEYGAADAICFAGGSLLGLEAAAGVAAEVLARNDYATAFEKIPAVAGAIIYDFRARNAIYPDKTLGRAAMAAAREGWFPLGARGAGRSASCGKMLGEGEAAGQGGAVLALGEARIGVFTVVNALGAIVSKDGRVALGNRDPKTGERRSSLELAQERVMPAPAGNTTITLLITNLKLPAFHLTQLGREVHSAMSRAIQPFHTPFDGDVLFTVATNAVEDTAGLRNGPLGVLAADLAWDAVLAAIPAL